MFGVVVLVLWQGLHLAFLDDYERPESTYGNNSNPDLHVLIVKVIVSPKVVNLTVL